MDVENNFLNILYMVKIMMKLGNHYNNNKHRYHAPNNQVMFNLYGKNITRKNNASTTKSCGSCLPPPSNSFDSILQQEHVQVKHQTVQREKEQREHGTQAATQEEAYRMEEYQMKAPAPRRGYLDAAQGQEGGGHKNGEGYEDTGHEEGS